MKTIVLTGMSGSGKTTVGRILSKITGNDFLDIDIEIEKNENKKINDIFSDSGELYFRNLEAMTVKRVFRPENLVISLGGGTFQNSEIRSFLLKNSNVIYLKTDPELILQRLMNCTDRPLLNNNLSIENLQNIMKTRIKNYELAHFTVVTDNKSKETVAKEILKCVNWK